MGIIYSYFNQEMTRNIIIKIQSNSVISNLIGLFKKLSDIQVFEISRVKYLKNMKLELTNQFNISIVFDISVLRDIEVQL